MLLLWCWKSRLKSTTTTKQRPSAKSLARSLSSIATRKVGGEKVASLFRNILLLVVVLISSLRILVRPIQLDLRGDKFRARLLGCSFRWTLLAWALLSRKQAANCTMQPRASLEEFAARSTELDVDVNVDKWTLACFFSIISEKNSLCCGFSILTTC